MAQKELTVPDLGGFSDIPVIEVLVAPGDTVQKETPLVTLESDKATMEVPASEGGVVRDIRVKVGDKVSQGSVLVTLDSADAAPSSAQHEAAVSTPSTAETAPSTSPASNAQASAAPAPSTASGTADTVDLVVPDIGDFADIPVIEVLVQPGDVVAAEAPLVTLESEKASMEVPASTGGTIRDVKVKVGDKVSRGTVIATVAAEQRANADGANANGTNGGGVTLRQAQGNTTQGTATLRQAQGDTANANAANAATTNAGATNAGATNAGATNAGATNAGATNAGATNAGATNAENPDVTLSLSKGERSSDETTQTSSGDDRDVALSSAKGDRPEPAANGTTAAAQAPAAAAGTPVHASPATRRFARELGVDIGRVRGSGPNGRITREDVQAFVKSALVAPASGPATTGAPSGGLGLNLLPWPKVDFAKFGPVERVALTRIQKISGPVLARNWVMIPHVTQNEEADVTELESFRKQINGERKDVKLTMLAFLMKAAVAALKRFPAFNSSLDGDELVLKKYYHLGFAADTPSGLVVPVVKDADQKGITEIARETAELGAKARDGKLGPADMSGATFTISSLGSIGGTTFTPIINAPEVAILGACRAEIRPVWDGTVFVPRLIQPLSLSYDHRVIDGANAARFCVALKESLADLRRVLL
jgi:pyruvate dehydrogenase E2 component (dihydrolipoamide acetyltransferase)